VTHEKKVEKKYKKVIRTKLNQFRNVQIKLRQKI